jgi:glycosyltransferase involved in cell wall biosynthesis
LPAPKNIMLKKTLASILIASYNKEKFVKRCINSCLNQTYKNIEIIFVDDDSTDKSFEIAKSFKKVKSFKKKNETKLRKFNTFHQIDTYLLALKKSKGDLIFFLDSDDFFRKNKVSELVKYFHQNKEINILFDKPIIYFSKNDYYLSKKFDLKKNNLWPNFPPQSCICIKRSFLIKQINEIKKKNFNLLTLDFRLATLSSFIYKDFNLLNKHLTYYFQDKSGESHFKFKKFGLNWWLRREQAFKYVGYLSKKYKIKNYYNIDYFISSLISYNIKLIKKFL